MLYPPYYCCPAASCSGRKLDNPVRAACRIYTLHRGVLPAYEVSLYCRGTLSQLVIPIADPRSDRLLDKIPLCVLCYQAI